MCRAKATLAYGLTVRSSSLVFAADAWTRLKHSFRFFQLVFLRRRLGGLVSTTRDGQGSVTKVPDEVWEEIRYWLVQEEIAQSENAFLQSTLCHSAACGTASAPCGRISWSNFTATDCDLCWTTFDELTTSTFANWRGPTLSNVTLLLTDFGLALPSRGPISTDSDNWNDPDALALIAAPSKFSRGGFDTSVVTASCGGDVSVDEETVVNVSFSLPENIDQRFTHLIQLFNLEVVSSSVNRLSSDPTDVALFVKKKTIGGKTNGINNITTKRARPYWKLWLKCEYEY
ncbi:hypothetical protein JCM3765_001846 [Sporobolomyces pararoseus]